MGRWDLHLTMRRPAVRIRMAKHARLSAAAVTHRGRSALLGVIGVALVPAIAVSACGEAEESAGSVSQGPADGAFESIDGMEATADQQPVPPSDQAMIARAEARLVASCMEGQGFDMGSLSPDDMVPAPPMYLSPDALRRSGYQYDWAAAAARYLELNGPNGPPDPTEGLSEAGAEAFGEALTGSTPDTVTLGEPGGGSVYASTEGCVADARVELYGSVANFLRYDRAIQRISLTGLSARLREDDSYSTALTEWHECMLGLGFDIGPNIDYGATWLRQQGVAALSTAGAAQTTVTEETIRAVAAADADCQESSGLFDIRQELLPGVQEDIAAELGFEMNQYIAFQHAVLDRAEDIP